MQSCSHNLVTFCAFGERASATDDFCDFLGNLRLTSLVSNTRQVGYQAFSVVSRTLHSSSTSCGLRTRSFQEHGEKNPEYILRKKSRRQRISTGPNSESGRK